MHDKQPMKMLFDGTDDEDDDIICCMTRLLKREISLTPNSSKSSHLELPASAL